MTAPSTRSARHMVSNHPPLLFVVYLVFAVVGLIATWWFNLRAIAGGGPGYLHDWFANDASSSAAIDLILVAIAACVFMIREGRRLEMRGLWLYVLLSPTVAIAFTFPLFLAMRERAMRRPVTRAGVDATPPPDAGAQR